VVIPALNEARNLPHVFAQIPPTVYEVILVDGHSVDDTVAVARQLWPDVRVVAQNRSGKGNALACGFAAATGDIIAMIDADGSADPGEIPQFVRALLTGADFAKGTRTGSGGGSEDITRLRHAGNRLLSLLFNACYQTRYTDLCYGYNVFWRRCLPALSLDSTSPPREGEDGRLWGDGFEIETLIHIRVAKSGLRVTEVSSFEHSRIHGVSNLSAFSDGMRVLRTIFAERRRARGHVVASVPVTEIPVADLPAAVSAVASAVHGAAASAAHGAAASAVHSAAADVASVAVSQVRDIAGAVIPHQVRVDQGEPVLAGQAE
jgi:glycosyltransferase involved in cell wall biosynthesis